MKILAVSASNREGARSLVITGIAAEAAREAGAEVELLDLAQTPLPLYSPDGYPPEAEEAVERVARLTLEADAYLLCSPEYHGSMSSAAKSFFDYHYHEFSGKLFGLMASTGGSQGVSCITHMRASVQYCHGWSLPYHCGVMSREFDGMKISSPTIVDRIRRIGRDTVIYGQLLHDRFRSDLADPESADTTFAGWHTAGLARLQAK